MSRTRLRAECSRQQSRPSSPATSSCMLPFRRGCKMCEMSHQSLNLIPPYYLYELLPPLSPSLPLQNSPAHSVLPATRPSQLLALHIYESGAQDSCTSHSACAQGSPDFHRRTTYPYHRPSCWRRHFQMFHSSSRSCLPQRLDLSFSRRCYPQICCGISCFSPCRNPP